MSNKYILNDDELGPIERTVPPELGKTIGPDIFHYWFYVKFNAPGSVYEACYQRFSGVESTHHERIQFYENQLKIYAENSLEFSKKWRNK